MKNRNIILNTLASISLATTASAIERSAPADQPKEKNPAAVAEKGQVKPLPIREAQPQNQQGFLGVFGRPVSPLLSTHLKLAEGTGLALLHVAPGSPAATAGLKAHDIITAIAGKNIGSQDDLRNAVLPLKPKSTVKLDYISDGKPLSMQIEIGSARAEPQARNGAQPNANPPLAKGNAIILQKMLEGFPPEQRKLLMKLMNDGGQFKAFEPKGLERNRQPNIKQLQQLFQGLNGMEKGMKLEMEELFKEFDGGAGAKLDSKIKMMDPQGSITLETKDGKKSIELRDIEGKLQYKGLYNNKADKQKVPAEHQARLGKLGINKLLKRNLGIQELLKEALKNPLQNKPGVQRFQFKMNGSSSSSSSTDPKTGNKYKLSKSKNGTEVEVSDIEGNLLYNGPYNSDFDKEGVPEEFRKHLERLDGNGIRFKLKNK